MNKLSALFTDLYELTMAQGYFKYEMNNHGVFDMFIPPTTFLGADSLFSLVWKICLNSLLNFRFTPEDL
jgi:nicotinate phosphoribosyltransferase